MEVAAFVFGVIPIALYALDNYDRCLRAVKDYWKYESTLKLIRSHIFLQQAQLDATMERLGLKKPTEEELRARLHEVYPDNPDNCKEFMSILEQMGELLEGMMRDLDVDVTQYLEDGKPKWSDALLNRTDWEWRRVRRSFSSKKREALVKDLQYWNSGLHNIVEAKPEIPFPEGPEAPARKGAQVRPTPQQCDAIRKDMGLLYEVFNEVGWACECPEHRAMVRLAWHVGVTPTAAEVGLSFPRLHSPNSWRTVAVNIEKERRAAQADTKLSVPAPPSPRLSPRLSPRGSGRLSPHYLSGKVKSKIKSARSWFQEEKRPSGTENGPAPAALPAAPLPAPPAIPVPFSPPDISCICKFVNDAPDIEHGVIRVQREVGGDPVVVNLRKRAADAEPEPAVLGSLLKSTKEDGPNIAELSRKHRLEIAAAVAWAALYLCDSPWLEEDWGGKEGMQIFFETEGPAHRRGAVVRAVYPSISHVFRSASSSREPAIDSMAPPATAAASFESGQIRNRALFTLGLFLLELGLGKTFDHIRQKARRQAAGDAGGGGGPTPPVLSAAPLGDYEIATRLIDRVYLDVGTMYGDALARCLRCEFPGRDSTKNFYHESFRKEFFSGVVEPLQATFTSCIA